MSATMVPPNRQEQLDAMKERIVNNMINNQAWKDGCWLGVSMGALLVGLAWGAVAGYNIYRDRENYRSTTGLMVLQLRNQDGTIAEFYNHTGTPLDDLRAPLGVETDRAHSMVTSCIDFAARADKRAVRLERKWRATP